MTYTAAHKTIITLFEEQAAKTPDNIALVSDLEQLTYRQLNERANQLAYYLRCKGVKPEKVVALYMERSIPAIIAILAVLKAGGAYLPLDCNDPPKRLAFILNESQADFLIAPTSDALPAIAKHPAEILILNELSAEISKQSPANLVPMVRIHNLAYIIYTSGSTGQPKGVEIEHKGLPNLAKMQIDAFKITVESRILQFAALNFDASVFEIWGCLANGAALYLPKESLRSDPSRLIDYIHNNKISIATLLPNVLTRLPIVSSTTLKTIVTAGDCCPKKVMDHWKKFCCVINAYGPTETTVCSHMFFYDGVFDRCIGNTIPHIYHYILDEQRKRVLPSETGELYIGGIGLARGYRNKPELTAEKFIIWPLNDKSTESIRLYKTGDYVRLLANKELEYIGRADFQIKFNGIRIEPGEIEKGLSQHPNIENSVVVLKKNNNREYLVAYLLVSKNKKLTDDGIRNHLKQLLPHTKIPGILIFLDAFPLLSTGKVNRNKLPQPQFAKIDPIVERSLTDKQKELRQLWSEVLNIDAGCISGGSNFFNLGGTSLDATQLALLIESRIKILISSDDIFANPTLENLFSKICHSLPQTFQPSSLCIKKVPYQVPLSFAQRRLWLAYQLMKKQCPQGYNIKIALCFKGILKKVALQKALRALIARQQVLRTYFPTLGSQAIGNFALKLNFFKLHSNVEPASHSNIKKIIDQIWYTDFGDLDQLPLMCAALIEIDTNENILALVFHHILIDALSVPVLIKELSYFYNHYAGGEQLLLPDLSVQYVDYARWQQQCLRNGYYQNAFAYWKQKLKGASALLDLPSDKLRPKKPSYHGDAYTFCFPEKLSVELGALARQKNVSLFSLLFTIIAALLYRYSQQQDFIIGAAYGIRANPQINQLIGFFVNMLPIRIQQNNKLAFCELLQQVHVSLLQAYQHNAPFEEIVDKLALPHHPGSHPLFQVSITMHNVPPLVMDFSGVTTRLWDKSFVTSGNPSAAKFDLSFEIELFDDVGLTFKIEYATDLFHKRTIKKMAEMLKIVCENVVQKPDTLISVLPLLHESDQKKLLSRWGQVAPHCCPNKSIVDLFREQVQQRAEMIAIVQDGKSLTYAQLNDQANQLAHYLLSILNKAVAEPIIGVALIGSIDFVVSILAILKLGGAYLPVDPDMPSKRLRFMLEDAKAQIVITHSAFAQNFCDIKPQLVILDKNKRIKKQLTMDLPKKLFPNNLAYIVYTSGSTGKPKGVMIEHASVVQLVKSTQYIDLSPNNVMAQTCNVTFDVSGFEIWAALLNGLKLVIYSKANLLDFDGFRRKLIRDEISILVLTTALFYRFLLLDHTMFCTVKWLVFAGEKLMSLEVIHKLLGNPEVAPQHLIHAYGPTEDTIFSTIYNISGSDFAGNDIPIGRPINGTITYVFDDQYRPVPENILGELCLGGFSLARGYLNRSDLTDENFIKNPFNEDGNRLYRTGDLVRYLANGDIVYVRRNDSQIKLSGYRIDLAEIEKVLMTHDNVKESVVVMQKICGDHQTLVAYIGTHDEPYNDDDFKAQLRLLLSEFLPQYMIPKFFVLLNTLPLTVNGKLDRQQLPEVDFSLESDSEYIAPSTALERALVSIWAKLLPVAAKIGITDDFFMLGGSSLLAIQLADIVNKKFGKISYSALFSQPTIRAQAALIQAPHKKCRKNLLMIDYLKQQIILDENIKPHDEKRHKYPTNPDAIFLTGVTGFLGAFLLQELLRDTSAEIYCLIRSFDQRHAQQRFAETLKKYYMPASICENNRIKLIIGNVAKRHLGLLEKIYYQLAEKIDIIYHVASAVNFVMPYSALKDVNVLGTKNMLRFAVTGKVKPLHYTSSAAIFSFRHYFNKISWLAEEEISWNNDAYLQALSREIGYVQSKAVAEKLIWQASKRKIPVTIYRLGFILCHNETGVGNMKQLWPRFIKDCLVLGYYPNLIDLKGEFITVGYVSQAISRLSRKASSIGRVFHIVPSPEQNMTTDSLFNIIAECDPGVVLKGMPFLSWRKRLECYLADNNGDLKLLLPLFKDLVDKDLSLFEAYQHSPHYVVENTQSALKEVGITELPINSIVMKNYIHYIMNKQMS